MPRNLAHRLITAFILRLYTRVRLPFASIWNNTKMVFKGESLSVLELEWFQCLTWKKKCLDAPTQAPFLAQGAGELGMGLPSPPRRVPNWRANPPLLPIPSPPWKMPSPY